MAGTITVKGTGTVKVAPDTVTVSFTLTAKAMEYKDMMLLAEKKSHALHDAAAAVGLNPDDLKTGSCNINSNYEHLPDEHGNYRPVFSGYISTQTAVLELPLDLEKLGKVFAASEQSGAEPELSLSFTVRDRFALQERVLTDAAQKARRNAEILAKASGVSLGALKSVSYQDEPAEPRSMTRCMLGAAKSEAMCDGIAINPEDITAEETAVFVWEIE
ncbi:MAG: SIMPL domain-containing protein [Oscillospiraceae bacterium]|nr:SIMPL domain-containing protein [Oscillospiraceae bacterium]